MKILILSLASLTLLSVAEAGIFDWLFGGNPTTEPPPIEVTTEEITTTESPPIEVITNKTITTESPPIEVITDEIKTTESPPIEVITDGITEAPIPEINETTEIVDPFTFEPDDNFTIIFSEGLDNSTTEDIGTLIITMFPGDYNLTGIASENTNVTEQQSTTFDNSTDSNKTDDPSTPDSGFVIQQSEVQNIAQVKQTVYMVVNRKKKISRVIDRYTDYSGKEHEDIVEDSSEELTILADDNSQSFVQALTAFKVILLNGTVEEVLGNSSGAPMLHAAVDDILTSGVRSRATTAGTAYGTALVALAVIMCFIN